MWNRFNKTDRGILLAAVVCFSFFTYLLYDQSFLNHLTTPSGPVVAKVERADNDVRFKLAKDFRWETIRSEMPIHLGDSVFTGGDSKVQVKLTEGSEIVISENSMITFNRLGDQITLGLKFGTVSGQLTGQLKVEGLEGQLSGDNAKFEISVSSGKVKVTPKSGNLFRVSSTGDKVRVEKKAAPEKDVPPVIMSPPKISKIIKVDEKSQPLEPSRIDVSWRHKKLSSKYEFQVAKDPEFKEVAYQQVVSEKKTSTPDLQQGVYYLRVRESLEANKETPWSAKVEVSVAYKEPERLPLAAPTLPADTIFYRLGSPKPLVVGWNAVEKSSQYSIEVSPEQNFKSKQTWTTQKPQFRFDDPQVGQYYFRVKGLESDGKVGNVSQVGRVVVTATPPHLHPTRPKAYIPVSEKDPGQPTDFKVSWEQVPTAKSYVIEVSKSPDFKKVKKFESRSPASVVPVPAPGQYHWRVRPLASTGQPLTEYSRPGELLYEIKNPLQTPALQEPLENMTLFFQRKKETPFWLAWQSVENAKTYTVEISQDSEFKKVVISKRVPASSYFVENTLPYGELFWRVRAENENRMSNWSGPRKVIILGGRANPGK